MKSLNRFFIASIIVLAVISCSSKHKQKIEAFEKGKIVEKVVCNLDKATNYALYLPSTYDTTKNYPLIVAFDSHGDGLIPVKLFKEQAEKYGYIVVGSNNSKNGLSWENNDAIFKSMITDIKERFKINESRIYTAGFSGGSRVASSIAIFEGGIAGVIGFSAGFPNLNQPINNTFDFLGVVGSSDFNYNEMNQLEEDLKTTNLKHYLIVFNGKHEWPSADIMPDVFYWLEFCAYRNKLAEVNPRVISEFEKICESEIELFKSKNDKFSEFKMYLKMICYLDKISETQKYIVKKDELEKSASVQNELRLIEAETKKEQSLQQFYLDAMSKNDIKWWEKEVSKIKNNILQNSNKRESFLYQRVLSYLSICAYSFSSSALQSQQLDQAQRLISIYILVDPENTDPHYFQAELSAMKNDTVTVFKSLEKAIDLGFNDLNKLQGDMNFTKFQSMPEWVNLMNKIKK